MIADESYYPDDDGVVPLEGGQESVPAQDLGLIQRPEAAEHFYVTLGDRVRHDDDARLCL